MAMISETANPNYEALKISFFKAAEGHKLTAYADSEDIPTIGIGLNLTTVAGNNYQRVLEALGINSSEVYYNQILAVINNTSWELNNDEKNDATLDSTQKRDARDARKMAELNKILCNRKAARVAYEDANSIPENERESNNYVTEFKLTENQSIALFNQRVKASEDAVSALFPNLTQYSNEYAEGVI